MDVKWFKISLLFLFSAALMGTLLRAFSVFEVPLQYINLVHSHSHVAFQGWVYTLLFLMVVKLFLTEEQIKKSRYPLQFKLTILIIIGVMISFILQGYGKFSIIFSSLFQLMNYWFILRVFKDVKNTKKSISLQFIKTGFWLGLLSTLAPWGIGILAAKGFANTEAYHSVIYFLLHFQYNGLFLFVLIGLLFKCLENLKTTFNPQKAKLFYWLTTAAVIPAYTLSLLGMSFKNYMYAPAIISGVLQLVGLFYLFQLAKSISLKKFAKKVSLVKPFLLIAIGAFSLKTILQLLSVIPQVEAFAFTNRFLILAYLHLCFIGVISFGLLGLLFHLKWLKLNWLTKAGSSFLLVGFLASEFILIFSGLGWSNSPSDLLILSAFMALGILLLLISKTSKKITL